MVASVLASLPVLLVGRYLVAPQLNSAQRRGGGGPATEEVVTMTGNLLLARQMTLVSRVSVQHYIRALRG